MRVRFLPAMLFGAAAPVAVACSGDDAPQPAASAVDAGSDERAAPREDAAAAETAARPDAEGDAGTAAGCVGNPLTIDGTTPDGGAIVHGAAQLVDERSARSGLLTWSTAGPQWVDLPAGSRPPGVLVFSSFDGAGRGAQLVRVRGDGAGRELVRDTSRGDAAIGLGNGVRGGVILTALGKGAAIAQTPVAGDAGADIPTADVLHPNDLVVGPRGDVYFTDRAYGSAGAGTGVYRIAPDGAVSRVAASPEGSTIHGIVLGRDRRLHVTAWGAAGGAIWSYTVNDDGSVAGAPDAARTVLVGAGATGGATATTDIPNGIALDTGNNLWVAEAPLDPALGGRVEVFSPSGARLGEIPIAGTRPTGIAFGGGKDDIVFITTESGSSGLGTAGVYKYTSRCLGLR